MKTSPEKGWRINNELLYNNFHFQEINNDLPQGQFYLLAGDRLIGTVSFAFESHIAYAPYRAPFGGFDFLEEVKSQEQLFFMVDVLRRLKEKGIEKVEISQAPNNLLPSELLINLGLMGFEKKEERVYQMIELNGVPLEEKLHQMERRKLKKASEMGFEIEWSSPSDFKRLFDFIFQRRQEKGFDFSMSWQEFKEYNKAFPENYFGIGLKHEGQLIAATILIKENNKSLYHFAPAHSTKYNRYSPMVLLTEYICDWAYHKGYQFLNLGTSYINEDKNESLFLFKQRLGAGAFIATSYQKVLNS